jgi:DNA-binding transcriptional regulator YhcF (GntR family)
VTAPYAQIVADIGRRIESGELAPGDRVPSARQITREWGVAIATATKALAALRQEGLVQAVPGVGTVVYAAPPHRRPPRQVELAPARIVGTAIDIADSEGLGALSMRRIATELGVATMALYRHVRSKEDLVIMMAEVLFERHPPPAVPPPGWRAQLEAIARLQWSVYGRHPWLAPVISVTRPQLMPKGMAHTDWTLRALGGLGLDPNTRMHAGITLLAYVRGMAMNFESEARARQDTGMTDQEWVDSQEAAFAAAFVAGPYPALLRLTADSRIDVDLDSLFEFGLRGLLDGYAVRFARTMGS